MIFQSLDVQAYLCLRMLVYTLTEISWLHSPSRDSTHPIFLLASLKADLFLKVTFIIMPACVLKLDLPNTPQINIGPKYFQNLAYVKFYFVHASHIGYVSSIVTWMNTILMLLTWMGLKCQWNIQVVVHGNYTFSSNLQLTNTPSNV